MLRYLGTWLDRGGNSRHQVNVWRVRGDNQRRSRDEKFECKCNKQMGSVSNLGMNGRLVSEVTRQDQTGSKITCSIGTRKVVAERRAINAMEHQTRHSTCNFMSSLDQSIQHRAIIDVLFRHGVSHTAVGIADSPISVQDWEGVYIHTSCCACLACNLFMFVATIHNQPTTRTTHPPFCPLTRPPPHLPRPASPTSPDTTHQTSQLFEDRQEDIAGVSIKSTMPNHSLASQAPHLPFLVLFGRLGIS